MEQQWTYQRAGVDIDAAQEVIERVGKLARKTWRPEVLAGIGGFAGAFAVGTKWKNPCLVAGSEGVGTKLKIAIELGKHDTVGIDLVAMSVNDILCLGAEPIFFLDYFACGKLTAQVFEAVLQGIVRGCEEARCTLLGGETAEMPDMYPEGEYDLAGFAVGVVDREKIIDGRAIRVGDVVIGLPSSGLHSNGFSLVRKVLHSSHIAFDAEVAGHNLAEELLRPTQIYVPLVLSLLDEVGVKGMAHITGGGIVENLPRVLPPGVGVAIDRSEIEVPWIFRFVQEAGKISEEEMWRVFNMGVGFTMVVAENEASKVIDICTRHGVRAFPLGQIVTGERKVYWGE